MTVYKNISKKDLVVHGVLVKAGNTIEHELIENPDFEVVGVSVATPVVEVLPQPEESATIKDETKEKK